MDTLEQTDLVVIELLDFDEALGCELPDCERAAEWGCRCRFCGHTILFCTPCREWMYVTFAQFKPRSAVMVCVRCRRRAAQIDQLAEWIPIKGGA